MLLLEIIFEGVQASVLLWSVAVSKKKLLFTPSCTNILFYNRWLLIVISELQPKKLDANGSFVLKPLFPRKLYIGLGFTL